MFVCVCVCVCCCVVVLLCCMLCCVIKTPYFFCSVSIFLGNRCYFDVFILVYLFFQLFFL